MPASILAVGMATYTTTIARGADSETVPEEGVAKPHHVTKNGAIVGFKNPYESVGNNMGFGTLLRTVVWYGTPDREGM